MRILSYFFIALCGLCPLYAHVDTVSAGAGATVSFPAAERRAVPAVSIRADFPFELYPEPDAADFHTAVTLRWQCGITVLFGGLTFSKTLSLFKNPSFTVSLNPFGSGALPDPGLGAGYSGSGSKRKPFAVSCTIPFGSPEKTVARRASIQCAGDTAGTYAMLFRFPFELADISWIYAVSVCSYENAGTVSEKLRQSVWFLDDAVFTDNGFRIPAFLRNRCTGVLQELTVRARKWQVYGAAGFRESPFGGFSRWGRIQGRVDVGVLSVNGGAYCGDSGGIGIGGTRIRNTLQAFLHPLFSVRAGSSALLRFGAKTAVNGRNSGGIGTAFGAEGKMSAGAECVFSRFSLRASAVWSGFSVYDTENAAGSDSGEYVGGTLGCTFRNTAGSPGTVRNVYSLFKGSAGIRRYPAGAGGAGKIVITGALSAEPDARGGRFPQQFLPAVAVSSESVFAGGEYGASKGVVSFTWNVREGIFRISGTVEVSFSF